MRIGRALASQLSLNGNTQHPIVRLKEILSRMKRFIHNQLRLRCKRETFIKCMATFGSGPAAPIRLIPVIAPLPGRSANTTENSCVTSTSCGAAPALRRALIFAALIATFSSLRNAGNSPEFGSRAIHSNSARRRSPRDRAERTSRNDCEPTHNRTSGSRRSTSKR
jgi:hypothetical protein